MKKTLLLTMGIALSLWACKPDTKGELGEESNKIEGITGTWEIVSFKQQDPNNPIREERDLSEFYIVPGQTPYRLTFDKATMTYGVTAGPGKNYFGTGGRWAFDNNEYPTYLYLYTPTDTLETLLGSVVRPSDNQLNIQLENYCEASDGSRTTTAIYTFTFNRLNP
jgi:hypothetical protein